MTTNEIKQAFLKWKRSRHSIRGDERVQLLVSTAEQHLDRDYIDVNDGDYEEAYELCREMRRYQ